MAQIFKKRPIETRWQRQRKAEAENVIDIPSSNHELDETIDDLIDRINKELTKVKS